MNFNKGDKVVLLNSKECPRIPIGSIGTISSNVIRDCTLTGDNIYLVLFDNKSAFFLSEENFYRYDTSDNYKNHPNHRDIVNKKIQQLYDRQRYVAYKHVT